MYSDLLRAQDAGSSAGQLWKDAQSAFDKGDFPAAAGKLNAIIKKSPAASKYLLMNASVIPPAPPNQQWMEPIFFMLGATYFNAKDWNNAISTFIIYKRLFPLSPRFSQISFSQGQAYLLGGRPQDSIPLFTGLLANPSYHVNALFLLVEADKRAGKRPDAISLLEKESALPNLNPNYLGKLRMKLLPMYLDGGDKDKATALLQVIDGAIAFVQDVTEFNALAVRLGDMLLAETKIPEALNCYRRVRDNAQILTLQQQQIENLKQQMAANMVRIQADPLNSDQIQADNKAIENQITKDQQILTQYQTLPPVQPPLFLRIGHAYSLNGALWEAAVVYREILRRWPHCKEAETALYASLLLFDKLKQIDRAQTLCQAYLTQYPQGKYADSVGYIHGILAYDAEDFDKAITYFQDSLKNQPNSPRREQIELIIGDINLRQQKFDDAIVNYAQYQKDFPHGAYFEQSEYRSALALLFEGKAEDADAAIRAYIQKYPNGGYVADAEYRLMVVKFAAKEYDQVIADGLAWQKKYGNAGPLAEVLSLMGDSYASMGNEVEAGKVYTRSYLAAQTSEVLNYSIFAAAKSLQKQERWQDIVKMFQDFIAANPDNPLVVSGIFWIGRADIKLGKVEEAKQYMASTSKQYLNDPSREAVDEIITQLAQLFTHKHLAVAAATASAPAAASAPGTTTESTPAPASTPVAASESPASTPPLADEDPATALEDILTIPDLDSKPTAQARILFAKAEIARLQRKTDIETQFLLKIAKEFKPEDLSPILLGEVGDCLLQAGQPDQAVPFYNQLMDAYDQSPLVDYAYNGLAQIAFNQKDYKKADRYFSKALDKGLAQAKLKEITLGEAQTLLALNRPDEAKPLFEQVASTREWRGEATALSVFSLGEIQMDLGKFPEANVYYQRVFVAYQKYPEIQAKAYLRSGEAFEKMGKIAEARNTYSEMLRNPNLASFSETTDAKQRLDHLPH